MSAQNAITKEPVPDNIPLGALQAQRLFELTQVDACLFIGRTLAEIGNRFQWQMDARYLLFERVCGQVLKPNLETGIAEPVSMAMVSLEDARMPQAEALPTETETTTIARCITDAAGGFRLFVPRFEIQWVLRFGGKEMTETVPGSEVRGLFFRATQDIDGSGKRVTICESVPWEVAQRLEGIPNVVLPASLNAISVASLRKESMHSSDSAGRSNRHGLGLDLRS